MIDDLAERLTMSGLRKLRRRQDKKYAKLITRIASRYGRKLSEVLVEFAKPFTDTAPTEEDFRVGMEMALLAWNLSFMPPDQQYDFMRKSIASLVDKEQEAFIEAEQTIWALVDRKKALYPEDRRFIVEHQLSCHGRDAHLLVAYEIAGQ